MTAVVDAVVAGAVRPPTGRGRAGGALAGQTMCEAGGMANATVVERL